MSLINSLHLTTRAPDHSGIFLLSAQEFKNQVGCNKLTVKHKNGLYELSFGFDYLDEDYVKPCEYEDFSDESLVHVSEYVMDVLRLWKLMQTVEPAYNDFIITEVDLPELDTRLTRADVKYYRWLESLLAAGKEMYEVANPGETYELFYNQH